MFFGKRKSKMRFVGVLDELLKNNKDNSIIRKNGTILIHPEGFRAVDI